MINQCEPDNRALLEARRQSNLFVGKGHRLFSTYSLEHTKGAFNGILKKHIFNVVLVNGFHSLDVGTTYQIEKIVEYIGNALKIKV